MCLFVCVSMIWISGRYIIFYILYYLDLLWSMIISNDGCCCYILCNYTTIYSIIYVYYIYYIYNIDYICTCRSVVWGALALSRVLSRSRYVGLVVL